MDGVTGILLSDGRAYRQVLEEPEASVLAIYERIRVDPRHTDVVVINNHLIEERKFSYWSMELCEPGQASEDAVFRLLRRLMDFDPALHHHFFDGAKIR